MPNILDKINLPLLREQRAVLLDLTDLDSDLSNDDVERLNGLISLIDSILDECEGFPDNL